MRDLAIEKTTSFAKAAIRLCQYLQYFKNDPVGRMLADISGHNPSQHKIIELSTTVMSNFNLSTPSKFIPRLYRSQH